MKYVFINPFVDKTYDSKELDVFLEGHRYKRVYTTKDWLEGTRDEYAQALEQTASTIVDMRCPLAMNIAKKFEKDRTLFFPNIEPILIHCAREISEREDLKGVEKIITSPCKCLADIGNGLNLSETRFYSWKDFLTLIGMDFLPKEKVFTPIPLGFFKPLHVPQVSLSGAFEITHFFGSQDWSTYKIIELLFCDQGCHNGDGVH